MNIRRAPIILGTLLVMTGVAGGAPRIGSGGIATVKAAHWAYATRQDATADSVLVLYPVNGNQLGPAASDSRSEDQRNRSLDDGKVRELWKYYTRLVPLIARRNLSSLDIVTDGPDKIIASVYRDDDDVKKWHLAVDYQDAYGDDGTLDEENMRDTLLHETGHMLTLGTEQVLVHYQECTTYEGDQGCSKPSSYINRFYKLFWKTHMEYLKSRSGKGYEQRDREFYAKYSSEFLTPYAATGVEEDMAETFAYFILYGKPYGSSVADRKVRFYYESPYFVRLRKAIRLALEPKR